MKNIAYDFNQIIDFASIYHLHLGKKRAILREYLQVKILEIIYREKISKNIFFIGGTSLRLLRNIDRFSEDLDFDIYNINLKQIDKLMDKVFSQLTKENFLINFYKNKTAKKNHYEFRFQNLLQELNISRNKEEKLMIKFDFESYWKGQKQDVILLDRYGYYFNVTTINKDQLIIQKLYAYLNRKRTLVRDIYDIVWLISNNAKPDYQYMKKNKIDKNIINLALNKFNLEKKKNYTYKSRLKPFLFDEEYDNKIDFFPEMIRKLEIHSLGLGKAGKRFVGQKNLSITKKQ